MAIDDDDDDHRQHQYRVNTGVMLIFFSVFFFIVVFLLTLYLCARYAARRHARRLATTTHHLMAMSTAAAQPQTHHEQSKSGLDPSAIATLPTFVYKRQADPLNAECAVCLSALEEEEVGRILPNCKHTFHVQCIDMWLHSHPTCPVCRTGVEPRAEEVDFPAVFAATAPPLDRSISMGSEGTSDAGGQSSKVGGLGSGSGSGSRRSSFRRILSRERSDRRTQFFTQAEGAAEEDVENR